LVPRFAQQIRPMKAVAFATLLAITPAVAWSMAKAQQIYWRHGVLRYPSPVVRCPASRAATPDASEEGVDAMLVRATGALRAGKPEEAGRLAEAARGKCADGSELRALADMVVARAAAATPQQPPSGAGAVAARLAARAGPVAWAPRTESPEQTAAMREGDAAVSQTVADLGAKDFVAAYESLEEARDAFRRAGEEVAQARAMTVDNLYGYILAERERNVRLQKLIRMKQIFATKRSLEDDGAERITRALSKEESESESNERSDVA